MSKINDKKHVISFFTTFLLSVFIAFCTFGCAEKEKPQNPTANEHTVFTGNYSRWLYFSFEKNDTITISDPKNSLDWDIAFHRWDVRTNGGLSGKGLGAAIKTATTDINAELSKPSDNQWKTDSLILTYVNPPVMNDSSGADQRKEVPGSKVLSGWVSVFMGQIPPTYTLTKEVFLVKSASGKVYRVQFKNYMNARAEKGYASFIYQAEK